MIWERGTSQADGVDSAKVGISNLAAHKPRNGFGWARCPYRLTKDVSNQTALRTFETIRTSAEVDALAA